MILTMYWKGKMDIIVLVLCLSLVAMDIIQSVDAKALDTDDYIMPQDYDIDENEEILEKMKLPSSSEEIMDSIQETTKPFLPKEFILGFTYNNTALTLVVRAPMHFVSNRVEVEQQTGDIMTDKLLSIDCFYIGTVLEWDGATASVDVCHNFRSIIVYNGEDIVIPEATLKEDFFKPETSSKEDGVIPEILQKEDTTIPDALLMEDNYSQVDEEGDLKHIMDEAYNLKFFGEEDEGKSRIKRQASNLGERYMEVLIVTDSSVADFHGRDILEQYLITQMNIVNNVYHHPSLGVEINLVVMKILVVDDSTSNRFVVRGSGKKTLDHFCQWAAAYQPQNQNYDIALFITRHDIGPAGYAPVTGMCNPRRSCAVQKDAGVSSAYVIAHEIGHVIGMGHDGYGNDCSSEPDDGKVMAATVQANFAKFYWTSCSRHTLMQHIGSLHCLNNKPGEQHWPEYSQPYGQTWTLDEQCRQEFGKDYKACRVFEHLDLCNTLWCAQASEPMLCKTKRGPPLPGTECGHNKWCMDGSCVAKKTVAVDGAWSEWSSWSECSLTCGVGAQSRLRKCNNPSPVHGGLKCSGESTEVKLCNTQKCQHVSDKRAEMCSKYDNTHYHGNRWHTWVPTESDKVDDQCKLSCISIETGDKLVSDSDVADGTKCSYDRPHDICAQGQCIKVGCDGVMDSNKFEDRCGVCGGDGTSCKDIYGTFNEELPRKEYHKVLTLPAQARDIVIRENPSKPYLAHFFAVKKEAESDLYLNNKRRQRGSRRFVIEGAKFRYSARGAETITARGPLLGNVEILIYSLTNKLPCSLTFEYNIPAALENTVTTETEAEKYDYKWRDQGFTECSTTCDGGTRTRVFVCFEEVHQKVVEDDLCSDMEQPDAESEECNTEPCYTHTFEWQPKEWSPCSRSCGKKGVQLRSIACMTINLYGTNKNWQVPQDKCRDLPRPASMRPCTGSPCPGKWKLESWSECSASCGSGTQTRAVTCGPTNSNAGEYTCEGEQPPDTRLCETKKCPDPTTTTSTTTTTTTSTTTSTTSTTIPTTTTTTTTTPKPTTTSSASTSTTEASTTPSTTKLPMRITRWWETPTPQPTKKSHPYRRKDNSVKLNDRTRKQELDIPKYPANHGSGWGDNKHTRQHHHHHNNARRHRHQHENSGDVDFNSLLKEKYYGQNEINEEERKHPELSTTQASSTQTERTSTSRNNYNRHSIFSILTERHHSKQRTHQQHRPTTTTIKTTTTTTTTTPSSPQITPCNRDKSFFCRMSLNAEKCSAPLYAKFCCYSCAYILSIS